MKTADNTQLAEKSDPLTWFDTVGIVIGSLLGFWAGMLAFAIAAAADTMQLDPRMHLAAWVAICGLFIVSTGSFFAGIPTNIGLIKNTLCTRLLLHFVKSLGIAWFAVASGFLTTCIIVTIAYAVRLPILN